MGVINNMNKAYISPDEFWGEDFTTADDTSHPVYFFYRHDKQAYYAVYACDDGVYEEEVSADEVDIDRCIEYTAADYFHFGD